MLHHRARKPKQVKNERIEYFVDNNGNFGEKKGGIKTLAEVNGLTKPHSKKNKNTKHSK